MNQHKQRQDSPTQNHKMLSYQRGQNPRENQKPQRLDFQGVNWKQRVWPSKSTKQRCLTTTEWEEIEREENRVREELSQAQPGDPLLGPQEPGPGSSHQETQSLPEILFDVITTRYGTVYHTNQSCRFLTAPTTGQMMIHDWCAMCRDDAARTGIIPGRGAAILLTGRRSDFHITILCERADRSRSYALCTECLETT